MSKICFGILGGDYRYKVLQELLLRDGYTSVSYGNIYLSNIVNTVEDLIMDANIIILPIPTSKDDVHIFMPNGEKPEIKELLQLMDKHDRRVAIGGVIRDSLRNRAEELGIKVFDFFSLEEVAVLNAVPTAEGAIQTAMEESKETVFGSKALVLGYGRCGKILANMLKGIGAQVSVTYRKSSDKAYISAYGMEPVALGELISHINRYTLIFNTIPAPVINKELLSRVNKAAVIIDLAQAPGGTDFDYARRINIKALYCPGLPGRVAPDTAARVLKDAVVNISLGNIG